MAKQDDKAASVEYLMLDYTRRLARHLLGRRAILIRLSRLRPENRGANHIRIAANTFEAPVKQFDGRIFLLQNADIVFICKDASIAVIDEAIMRLRYLFGDDPLAAELAESGPDRFATWYDLEREYREFLSLAEALHEQEARRKKRIAATAGGAAPDERQPMDPPSLAELVNTIERADLSNLMRRQAVCTIMGDEPPQPLFREIYVSIPDLRDAVLPGRDIASDRWLFQYLTQALDKRVLALLRRNDDRAIARSYSLNLNISTVLSPDFQQFDQTLVTGARGTIVIELQKADIFADIGAYVSAREFLKERGYRVCLDGVAGAALGFIDRERLGLDFIKLFWSPEMADPLGGERAAALRDAVQRGGGSRIVLARCDSVEAVSFGRSIGIRLFQGRHVDRLLSLASLGGTGARAARPAL